MEVDGKLAYVVEEEEYGSDDQGVMYVIVSEPVIEDSDDFSFVDPSGNIISLPYNENTERLFGIVFPHGVEGLTPKKICDGLYGDTELNPWRGVPDFYDPEFLASLQEVGEFL